MCFVIGVVSALVLKGDISILERYAGSKATVVGLVRRDSVQVMFVAKHGTMTETLGAEQQPATTTSH